MTLIVSQACNRFVLQVSDRLVTSLGGGRSRPHDAASNKTVLFQARDGIASLSYTGLSYIGDQPTDSWIAELLIGHRMKQMDVNTPFTMLLGKREGPWHFMGPALQKIATELTAAAHERESALLRYPVIVVVAGWLWYRRNRKHPRPFFAGIQQAADGRYTIQYGPRLFGNHFFAMPVPSSYLRPEEKQPFLERLKPLDPELSLSALVGTVRMVAARTDTVGPDCMSVLISHPFAADRLVSIKYIPRDPYTFVKRGSEVSRAAVAFSPWLVGRSAVVAPSFMIGGGPACYRLGPYAVTVASPPADAPRPVGIAMLNSSQKRPSRP